MSTHRSHTLGINETPGCKQKLKLLKFINMTYFITSNSQIIHAIKITEAKLVIELLSRQLTIMAKIIIHIYLNMIAMKTINTLIWTI